MSAETLSIVRASIQRAQHDGEKSVSLKIQDLLELLPFIEGGMHRERMERPMKFGGWASPRDLQSLPQRKSGNSEIKLRRFKTPAFNTEVFFCDDLKAKVLESDAAALAIASTKATVRGVDQQSA